MAFEKKETMQVLVQVGDENLEVDPRKHPDGQTILIQIDDKGRVKIPDFSPFAKMTEVQREKAVMSWLESRMVYGGSEKAAAVWLSHRRWRKEMTAGKATQKVDLNKKTSHEIVLVDNLTKGIKEAGAKIIDIAHDPRATEIKKLREGSG